MDPEIESYVADLRVILQEAGLPADSLSDNAVLLLAGDMSLRRGRGQNVGEIHRVYVEMEEGDTFTFAGRVKELAPSVIRYEALEYEMRVG